MHISISVPPFSFQFGELLLTASSLSGAFLSVPSECFCHPGPHDFRHFRSPFWLQPPCCRLSKEGRAIFQIFPEIVSPWDSCSSFCLFPSPLPLSFPTLYCFQGSWVLSLAVLISFWFTAPNLPNHSPLPHPWKAVLAIWMEAPNCSLVQLD